MSVGLGRGHLCIEEALNLEPLYLRLSPRVQVPVTHSSSSSFSLNYQSEDTVPRPSLSLRNLTLRFQVSGPKPPAEGPQGTDCGILEGDVSCFLSSLNCACLGLLSFL